MTTGRKLLNPNGRNTKEQNFYQTDEKKDKRYYVLKCPYLRAFTYGTYACLFHRRCIGAFLTDARIQRPASHGLMLYPRAENAAIERRAPCRVDVCKY